MLASVVCGVLGALSANSAVQAVPAVPDPKGKPLTAQVTPFDRHGGEVHGAKRNMPVMNTAPPPAPVWPAPGIATVGVADAATSRGGKEQRLAAIRQKPGRQKVGSLPVWIKPSAGQPAANVSVELLDRAKVPPAWRDGLVLRVSARGSAGLATTARAASSELSVSYDAFRFAYGGDWASRLRLWQVPACSVTTPNAKGCEATVLPSANNTAAGTVSASIRLSNASAGTLMALSAAASGSDGSMAATPLGPSSTWSAGGSTGEFTWSYPMRVPPSAGGPMPSLGLSYSSSSVDGRSETTNNQPSWIGEGFEFSPGFIERKYISCSEDMTDDSNNKEKTGDLCWKSDNASMTLNGRSTELIYQPGKGWHGRTEDGSEIKKLTNVANSNGDDDGEYWQVTTTDGMTYYFGRNKLPGQSSDTASAWTVPVYGNDKNDPCYDDTGTSEFAKSRCKQAWRWNLDYVVDARGNTMSYWYDQELNAYASNMKDDGVVPYVRGGTLRRVDYGTWDRSDGSRSTTARGQVRFDTADRCQNNCTQHTAAAWPDVPWDQECKTDAKQCKGDYSPTFWSTQRLAKITTSTWDTSLAAPKWQDVDSWTLNPSYPSPEDGTHPGLWLSSIVHKGLVHGEAAMPPVVLTPTSPLANRVETGHAGSHNWQRLGGIVTESGAKTVVIYSLPECTEANTEHLAPQSNTKMCYPIIVPNPSDMAEGDVVQWWHKYRVDKIVESDIALTHGASSPGQVTYYGYPNKPAWHYADDDGFTKASRKTWSQFRGYDVIETRMGEPGGPRTLTETKYLRGMHDDRIAPAGGKRDVKVDASFGNETVYDEDQFAGMVREQTIYNSVDTKPVSRTVNVPWRSSAKASRTINGDVAAAHFTGTKVSYQGTALGVDGARGWRTTRSATTFNDADGTVATIQNDGDTAKTGDEQCVTYTYNNNTAGGKNFVGLTQQVTTKAVKCADPVTKDADIISDVRFSYDGAAGYLTPPSIGSVTRTEQMNDWTAAKGTIFRTVSEETPDAFGRTTASTDVRGHTTVTTYEPATLPAVKVTSVTAKPWEWKTSVARDPYWGFPATSTDVNGGVVDVEYDPLGRTSKIWSTGWPKAGNKDKPTTKFEYGMSADYSAYPYVRSQALNAAGQYNETYAIYDSYMRPRQVQTLAHDGNRVVTDTIYDQFGNAVATYPAHDEIGGPASSLWWEPEWSLRRVQRTVFDGANRPRVMMTLGGDGVDNLVEKWRTTTVPEGDLVKVTPPLGATATTTVMDAQGRARELRLHTTLSGVDGAFDSTFYDYNNKDQLIETVDPAKNRWSTRYDVLGRVKSTTDPDKGTTSFTYDPYGAVQTTTTAAQSTIDSEKEVLFKDYDELGRPIGLYDDSKADANKRATWSYDTLYDGTKVPGQLVESTRYDNKRAYTQRVMGFTLRMQPTSVDFDVPAAETGLGGTYSYAYNYSPFDGTALSTTYPKAGDLPTEKVTTGLHGPSGLPVTLETNFPGATKYITDQQYTRYGEPTLTWRKINGQEYVQSGIDYDAVTRAIKHTVVKPEWNGSVADRTYERDTAGNVISTIENPQVGDAEKQCFGYDTLERLVSAWTPTTTTACSAARSVDALAGTAPYWTEWVIDKIGNRTEQVSYAKVGKTTQTYGYPPSGTDAIKPHALASQTTTKPDKSTVTTAFHYDKIGNMIGRVGPTSAQQTLSWDSEGKLSKVVEGPTTTSNVYDDTGQRLIRRDAGGTTLYLPGMEIRRAAGATTATRYYSFAGTTIASRTKTRGLEWLFSDAQGTQQTAINAVSHKVTVRRQTPYGAPRGTQPAWPNGTGFVGGDTDPTGLTHLGAREYDPELGRFISVDPLLDLADPQQWNGYAYANNTPITASDPTGMIPEDCRDHDCYGYSPDAPGHKGGCPGGCGTDKNVRYGKSKKNWSSSRSSKRDNPRTLGHVVTVPADVDLAEFTRQWYEGTGNQFKDLEWQTNGPGKDMLLRQQEIFLAINICKDMGGSGCDRWINGALLDTNWEYLAPLREIGSSMGDGFTSPSFANAYGGPNPQLSGVGNSGSACSFSGDTSVLMADGSSKPFSEVTAGDAVMAADPETGEVGLRTVTHLWVHQDDFVKLQVSGKELTTTEDHPFWNATDQKWERADELDAGDLFLAYRAHGARVEGILRGGESRGLAYNLTVDGLHTYYVLAGNTPVLVHNDCGPGSFYRGAKGGGPTFAPKPGEYRVDSETGFVKGSHGVSVFNNTGSLKAKKFDPHAIDMDTMPSTLRIIQRGNDPKHYEIVPAPGANLTPERYAGELSKIRCTCG
jgi:RHS repeat-associated protein